MRYDQLKLFATTQREAHIVIILTMKGCCTHARDNNDYAGIEGPVYSRGDQPADQLFDVRVNIGQPEAPPFATTSRHGADDMVGLTDINSDEQRRGNRMDLHSEKIVTRRIRRGNRWTTLERCDYLFISRCTTRT